MPKLNMKKILEKAEEYHKFNWLEEAEKFYRIVLADNPDHPKVNHNLGVLAMQVNKPEIALVLFEKALRLEPENIQFQQSLDSAKMKLQEIVSFNQNIENINIFELKGNDFIFERKIHSLENKLHLLNDKLNNIHEALNYL